MNNLAKLLKKQSQGLTNLKLGKSPIKYTTLKVEGKQTQATLSKAMEDFQFADGYRYWISGYYRFGRRGGASFDGNNFTGDALYNVGREYQSKDGRNAGANEEIRYLTIYSAPLPARAGGKTDYNDCLFNSLESICKPSLLPKIIRTPKKLKDYLGLERGDMIGLEHIEPLEKAFPENTSITISGDYNYKSLRENTSLNFNILLRDGHYTPICNEGKSKRNINTKLHEFEFEKGPLHVYACYCNGNVVTVYNGTQKEITYNEFKKMYKTNIIIMKDMKTNEPIKSIEQLKPCYDFYLKMAKHMKDDSKGKVCLLKYSSLLYFGYIEVYE